MNNTANTDLYEDLLSKIQPYYDWAYSDNCTNKQFQQFPSGKYQYKTFKYIMCKILNNNGKWCTAR